MNKIRRKKYVNKQKKVITCRERYINIIEWVKTGG